MSSRDDEGLIDLSSLLATPSRRAEPQSIFPSETPPAAFALDEAGAGRAGGAKMSRGKLIAAIAGGVVVLLLAGTGTVFAFRGEKAVAIAPAAPPPPPVAAAPAP